MGRLLMIVVIEILELPALRCGMSLSSVVNPNLHSPVAHNGT